MSVIGIRKVGSLRNIEDVLSARIIFLSCPRFIADRRAIIGRVQRPFATFSARLCLQNRPTYAMVIAMAVEVVTIRGDQGDLDRIRKAAELVEAGGLVAFPTETVYGIACRVERKSLSRLDKIKGREANKHYTLHIGQIEQFHQHVPRVGIRAEKLIRQAWPGPLTLVFELARAHVEQQSQRVGASVAEVLYKDDSIGVRYPDHPVAALLLRLVPCPVVAPSANRAGREPPTDADQVLAALGDDINMLLDAGPCKYKNSSTVAMVGRDAIKVLREGVYSQSEIRGMSQVVFLFVCTGNTCRSPMGEGLFRKHLAEKIGCSIDELEETGYKVLSAGTMNLVGVPASAGAVTACSRKGVDLRGHASRHLTRSLIDTSDVIFCMTRSHCEQVLFLAPDADKKCLLLAQDRDVPDPIGQAQPFFDGCADIIESAVKARISELVL